MGVIVARHVAETMAIWFTRTPKPLRSADVARTGNARSSTHPERSGDLRAFLAVFEPYVTVMYPPGAGNLESRVSEASDAVRPSLLELSQL